MSIATLYTIAKDEDQADSIAQGIAAGGHLIMLMKYGKDVDTLFDSPEEAKTLGGAIVSDTTPSTVYKVTIEAVTEGRLQ